MKVHQAQYPVATMCRLLEVSTSGYYAWLNRAPSARALANVQMTKRITAIHQQSRCTYGVPRVHAELREQGVRIGGKRIAHLMRSAGLRGVCRRRGFRTTIRDLEARPAPDLVDRQFRADTPDRLWVADITYIPTVEGFLFLAVVLDVCTRRVVGWAMADHLRAELVVHALNMALFRRRPLEVVHHSDQGTQYTSIAFGQRCKEAGVRPSMGSVGDCFDNAMCESFFATLECELLARHRFQRRTDAELAVFAFIEGWYNPHRRHSRLGYLSPINFEKKIKSAEIVLQEKNTSTELRESNELSTEAG